MTIAAHNKYVHGSSGLGGLAKFFGVFSTRTLAQRVSDMGATVATLEIYNQETISADLEIPDNITVVMKPGSLLTISGTGTSLHIANCICEGIGPFFSIGATCTVTFGKHFEAGKVSIFTGAGLTDRGTMASTWSTWGVNTTAWLNPPVQWGLGQQMVTDRTFATWTKETNWSNPVSGTLRGTAATFSNGAYCAPSTPRMNQFFIKLHVSSYTGGSFKAQVQNSYTGNIVNTGWFGKYLTTSTASSANKLCFVGITSHDFTGDIDFISMRKVISTNVSEIFPEWFGAIADGLTDCTTAIQVALHCASNDVIAQLRTPHIVKLNNGCYVVTSTIAVRPRSCLIGSGCGTTIQVGDTTAWAFTGNKLFSVTDNYNIGNNKDKIFGDFCVDTTQTVPSEARPFFVFYIQCAFDHSHIDKIRIDGPVASGNYDDPTLWETVGFYFGPTGASYHSLRLTNCNLTNCNSWAYASIYLRADAAAAQNLHIGDNMVTALSGLPMSIGCINSHIYNNLINTYPIWGLCIKKRGHSALKKAVTGAAYNGTSGYTELTGFTLGNVVNSGTTHESVFITGFTGDWAAINGLWPIKTGSSATKICIPVNSGGFAAYGGSGGQIEIVGGRFPRWWITARNNFTMNYIDGSDYTINAVTQKNATSLNEVATIHGGFNLGFDQAGIINFCDINGAPVTYAATQESSDPTKLQFGSGVNLTAYFPKNFPVAIYQVGSDGHIYGYVVTTVSACSYSGGYNHMILTEGIVRSDTTITIYMMDKADYNLVEGLDTAYMGSTIAQNLKIGSGTVCNGSSIQHAKAIMFTCSSLLTIAPGATATIIIPVTEAMDGAGAKYSVFITPPTTIPAYISFNAFINSAATEVTVQLKNTDASTSWTYSSTVWNAFIIRALA
jgi:hypothetical protein